MEDKGRAGTPTRDLSARWWRQVGFWGLTLNAVLGFPAMVALIFLVEDAELGTLAGAYATILAAWTAAAGIRQWGKNRGSEAPAPVRPTRPGDDAPLTPPDDFVERTEE